MLRHTMNSSARKYSLRILAAGALSGAVLGMLDITGWLTPNQQLNEESIATVNNTNIRLLEYQRALNMLASEKRDAVSQQDRDLVLQRLIDEELLIQHGINSELIRNDLAVRAVVLESILAGIMIDIEASNNKSEALEDYLHSLHRSADIKWSSSWVQP